MTLRGLRVVLTLTLLFSVPCSAQETITEPSTGKTFPAEVKFTDAGKEYTLKATGTAVRKKIFFKVYGMVHYMQDPERTGEEQAFRTILTDGKAKEITMEFVRDVTTAQIRDAYRDGFKQNATTDEMKEITSLVDKFLQVFDRDVKEGDRFTLRWSPGGRIIPIVTGAEKPSIQNTTFARVLWSIWFGGDSIVDREDLVSRMVD